MLKLVLLLLLFSDKGRNLHVKTIEPKTLTREIDPVIIPAQATDFQGHPIDNFRLFSCNNGELIPIPFQIDERKENKYLLPQGPKPDPGDGIYNDQDELVFMAADSGDRCRLKDGNWTELELVDPADNSKGWVYLTFDKELPLSEKSYVSFDPDKKLITTTRYFLKFNMEHPIFFDQLGIKKSAGGTGKNTIDRMKIRFSARLVGGFISINKTEEDFETKLLAYHAGPVRVIRLTRNWQTLFWKIPTPAADIVTIFYDSSFEFPVVVDLPFDVGLFLKKTSFRVSIDMRKEAGTRLFYNSNNTSPVVIDGEASKKYKIDTSPFSWMANAGTGETPAGWFNRIFWSAPGNPGINIRLYFKDDISTPDPPENERGEYGDLGYEITGLETVKKGKIFIKSVMYWFPSFTMDNLKKFLNINDRPIKIIINKL